MALFFKKKKEDELASMDNLPPLPPLPDEDQFSRPQQFSVPQQQAMPELPSFPAPRMPSSDRQTTERATVFVRVDKYKEIMQTVESMQRKVNELQDTLNKIASIKEKEAEIIHGWGAMLQETKSKVDEVNSKLLRPSEA